MPSELITETFDFDGGRAVTVHVPRDDPHAVVYCGDGQVLAPWGADLDGSESPATMIVGVHRLADETTRLQEYSPGFDPARFTAHERFLVDDVRAWVRARFRVDLPAARTAIWGVSAGGDLALALGLRHPDVFGAILCASPGGGFQPPDELPGPTPRTYLLAGTGEPFFLENAARWADALRRAGADVEFDQRDGEHGGPLWRQSFPRMVEWAFATTSGWRPSF